LTSAFVEPRNEVEASLAGIWRELLGVDRVGIHDSFFEMGGHSLLAIQIAARLRERYRIELPLKRMFESVTIADLAPEISALLWAAEAPSPMSDPAESDREEFRL